MVTAACAPAPKTTVAPVDMGPYGARTDQGPSGEPIDIHAVRPPYLTDRNRRQQRMCRLEIAIADAREYPVRLHSTHYRTRSPWLGPVSVETGTRIGAAT